MLANRTNQNDNAASLPLNNFAVAKNNIYIYQ